MLVLTPLAYLFCCMVRSVILGISTWIKYLQKDVQRKSHKKTLVPCCFLFHIVRVFKVWTKSRGSCELLNY
jgi:hypothetical protein